jgi:hypothetical protein
LRSDHGFLSTSLFSTSFSVEEKRLWRLNLDKTKRLPPFYELGSHPDSEDLNAIGFLSFKQENKHIRQRCIDHPSVI